MPKTCSGPAVRKSGPPCSTRSHALNGFRVRTEEAFTAATAGVVRWQLLADLACARAQRRDDLRFVVAALAPFEELAVELLETHARALVERIGRALELAEYGEPCAFDRPRVLGRELE